jgi:Uma2 family endonuclease
VKSGVKLVWLVDPDARIVIVYQGSLAGSELSEADTLTAGDVLPGFSCQVADLFA